MSIRNAINYQDIHPSLGYEYGVGYDSPRKRDLVKNPSTENPRYYPVNYPFTHEDLKVELEEDVSDADIRLYPKRDTEIKYKNDERKNNEKFHRHVLDQSVLKFEGKDQKMDEMIINAVKFKNLRQHDKIENPNAKKLLSEIKSLLKKENEQRASALLSRYNKRYKQKLKLEDLKEKVYAKIVSKCSSKIWCRRYKI